MTALTFDTCAAVKEMKNSGLAEAHAKSIVAATQAGIGHLADLAIKESLKNLVAEEKLKRMEAELKEAERKASRAERKASRAEIEAVIVRWELNLTFRLTLMIIVATALAFVAARYLL